MYKTSDIERIMTDESHRSVCLYLEFRNAHFICSYRLHAPTLFLSSTESKTLSHQSWQAKKLAPFTLSETIYGILFTMTRHCVLLFVFLFPCVLSTPSNDMERELGRLFYNFNYKAGYRFENPLRQLREPCIVTLTEVLAGSRNDTPPELGCMLQGSDVVGDINDYEIRVDGVNSTYVEQLGLLSFESTLFAEGAVVDEGQKMVFMPWGTEIQVGKVESHERRLTSATGDKHVLALRVQGSGSAVSKSEAQISQSLFGFADSFNIDVKTQMEDCSDGKLRILKASDSANMPTTVKNAIGDDSVYTVTIDMDISAQSNLIDVVNKATEQFQTDFGVTLKSLAANPSNPDDLLVIFCIPPGTGNWQGFATRNGWKSWYNDEECTFLSVLMHEIGHNLNLAHSGKGDYSYGDYTGYMGETFSEVGLPLMCFNAPKTYQLNW